MACGGKKAFACTVRPDLADDPEKALRWLLDCLNTDRRQKLGAEELKRACREAQKQGCHILKHWFDDATGYQRTEVAPKKSEHERLAAELQRLAAKATDICGRLGEIERQKLQAVK